MERNNPRLALISAAVISLRVFMLPHIEQLRISFEITTICNATNNEMASVMPESVNYFGVKIERKINLLADLCALFKLVRVFQRKRFQVVVSITPKAGLLSMLAAFICRVPVRTHIFTGQVWANRTGLKRYTLKFFDRLIAVLSTHVLADSPSQSAFLIAEGVVPEYKIKTIASGSICGVAVERFARNITVRQQIRDQFHFEPNAIAALFIGRMTKEKGIFDLAHAFTIVAKDNESLHLFLVGPDEESVLPEIEKICGKYMSRVHFMGLTNRPEDYMSAADFLCLPSYREGFGLVVIEAAAASLPALVSNIYGLTDAVVADETGIFHERGDIEGIAAGMGFLANDTARRMLLGENARIRATRLFSNATVVQWVNNFYCELLK